MNESKLSEVIKEFLFTATDNTNQINAKAKDYITMLNSCDDTTNSILEKLESNRSNVSHIRNNMENLDLIHKLKKYIHRENVYRLFELSLSLTELSATCVNNLEKVPDIIQKIIKDAPLIPSNSAMKTLLISTISKIKTTQLQFFQDKFEKHLQREANSSDDNIDTDSWVEFLSTSKVWLTSYCCVTLLPVVLTESKSLVSERHTQSLDEALTPLWGRFHFHLSATREKILSQINSYASVVPLSSSSSSSFMSHIAWSFSYARNFIELMLGLCTEIMISDKISFLQTVNFHDVAKEYVVNKATRFMRAHLAGIISALTTLTISDDNCLSIVEECFSIDHYLSGILIQPICVSHVIYDAKEFYFIWLNIEYSRFTALLTSFLQNSNDTYNFEFGSRNSERCHRCYKGVYNCMKLFILATKRYQYLPAVSQDMLSQLILEPMLCLCIGLFLLHTRANSSLFGLSNHRTSSMITHTESVSTDIQQTLKDFIASTQYFQHCLKQSACYSLAIMSSDRYDQCWKRIHMWFPNRFITAKEFNCNGNYSALRLFKVIFRDINWEDISKQPSGILSTKETIGSVIDMVRAQSITLSKYYENFVVA